MASPKGKQQREVFARLCGVLSSPALSVFVICAYCDLPYYPEIKSDDWEEYASGLEELDEAVPKKGFENGTTVFSEKTEADGDWERWRSDWGLEYTEDSYKRLDQLFATAIEPLTKAGIEPDPQQELSAREYAKLILLQDQYLFQARTADDAKENSDYVTAADRVSKMAREKLKDSNMRKADQLPQQRQRPDGFVDMLRRKYGLGPEMTFDQVMEAFYKWCRGRKHPQTVDAEEHAIMAILRTIQRNDDLPEPTELPDGLNFSAFAGEFADVPNEQEQEAYQYLNLVRGEYHKEGAAEDGP